MSFKEQALKTAGLGLNYVIGAATILAVPHLMVPPQDVYEGNNTSTQVPSILKKNNVKKPLIITDANLMKFGVTKPMLDALDAEGYTYAIYDKVEPNPTIANIEDAFAMYRENGCDSIIGFGGGSSMDSAKAVSGRVVKPNMTIKQMGRLMGYLPISLPYAGRTPLTIAIPTTAGTGAESTPASVISDHESDKKYTVTDGLIRPDVAVLDPTLAIGLPKFQTAITAIDAVSHCIEGYIGLAHNARDDEFAEQGVRLVFDYVDRAYKDGKDIEARAALTKAAYDGGQGLNSGTTGYIHPFCHKIGAMYNLPHGRCIGAVMPIILEDYGTAVEKRLGKLGAAAGISDPSADASAQAKQFIQALRDYDDKYGIDQHIPELKEEDFPEIADSIMKEIFVYPTKVVYSREDIYRVLRKIKG